MSKKLPKTKDLLRAGTLGSFLGVAATCKYYDHAQLVARLQKIAADYKTAVADPRYNEAGILI